MTNLEFPEASYELKLYAENGEILIDSCKIFELDQCM